jgi:hypothetical protein
MELSEPYFWLERITPFEERECPRELTPGQTRAFFVFCSNATLG